MAHARVNQPPIGSRGMGEGLLGPRGAWGGVGSGLELARTVAQHARTTQCMYTSLVKHLCHLCLGRLFQLDAQPIGTHVHLPSTASHPSHSLSHHTPPT